MKNSQKTRKTMIMIKLTIIIICSFLDMDFSCSFLMVELLWYWRLEELSFVYLLRQPAEWWTWLSWRTTEWKLQKWKAWKMDFVRELKKLWNMKMTVIPIISGVLGTISKGLFRRLEELEIGLGGGTILLISSRILRRVLGIWGDLVSLKLHQFMLL